MISPSDRSRRSTDSASAEGGADRALELLFHAFRALDFPVAVVDRTGAVLVISRVLGAAMPYLNLVERKSSFLPLLADPRVEFGAWLEEMSVSQRLRLRQRNGGLTPMLQIKASRLTEHGPHRDLWVLNIHLPDGMAQTRHEREILLRISSIPIPQLIEEGVALTPEQPDRCPITVDLLKLIGEYLGSRASLLFRRIEPTRLAVVGAWGFERDDLVPLLTALAQRSGQTRAEDGVLDQAASEGYTFALDAQQCGDPAMVELLRRLPFRCHEVWVDGIGRYGAAVTFFVEPPSHGNRLFSTAAHVRLGRHLESAGYTANMYEAFLELRQTQEQIIQSGKMAALGELTAGVAHELRQPVTAINNFITTVFDHLEAGRHDRILEKLAEYRERSRRNIDRISRIVDHMRNFARAEANQFQATNLPAFLEEIYHTFLESQFKTANITTTWEFPPDLPMVDIDPPRIEQVVLNLFSNARDAVEGVPDPRITVSARHGNGRVRVTISDNGPGIAKELLDKVMNPFFSTKPVGKGAGVGLSISHGILKGHNGQLDFGNNPGRGASFTIDLPVRQPNKA